MSKDLPDAVESGTENSVFVHVQGDLLNSFMAAPVNKLDADQYLVNDLDGVTESLFGSGNMNFLMMQAGQTDESIRSSNLFDMTGGDDSVASSASPFAAGVYAPTASMGNDLEALASRSAAGAAETGSTSEYTGGQNSHAAATGHFGASALSANTQSSNSFSSVQNFGSTTDTSNSTTTITNGQNGNDGTPGSDGSNGSNGADGSDGQNGNGDGDVTIINVDVDIDNHLGDLTEIVENITNTTTDILTTITNNVFDTINNIIDGADLGPIGLDLGLHLDDLTDLTLDIFNGDNILNVINETIDLSGITTPVTDLLGDLAAGLDLGILLDPFAYDNSPGDHDLHITTDLNSLGIPLLPNLDFDIPLDLVETLVGDLDINLNVTEDLLNLLGQNDGSGDTDLGLGLGSQLLDMPLINDVANVLFNPVEDLVGDIDLGIVPSLDLFGTSETSNALGDTDITIPLDINLAGHQLLDNLLQIPLDPVEAITGDIDLDLTVATDLLGQTADGLLDTMAGGSDTGNILSDIGDQLSGITGSLLPDADAGNSNIDLSFAGDLLGTDIFNNTGSLNLDLVEGLVGGGGTGADTDLGLGLGSQFLDMPLINDAANVLFNPVEDLVGDIDLGIVPSLDLFGTSETSNAMGDTDITIPLDINLAGHQLLDNLLQIPLDPVEVITGDIDLDLSAAADLLGHTADGLLDTMAGGSDTGNILSDIGDQLSGITGSLFPDADAGDSDIDLSFAGDLLGTDILNNTGSLNLDLVEDLVGDIDLQALPGLDILGDGGTGADTDLVIPLDLSILGEGMPAQTFDINLDLVENLTGDIDLDLSAAADLLPDPASLFGDLGDIFEVTSDLPGNSANLLESILNPISDTLDTALGILDNAPSSSGGLNLDALGGNLTDLPTWTENLLPDAGSSLGSGLGLDIAQAIPDLLTDIPVISPALTDALGGGLGGLKHLGGLFG